VREFAGYWIEVVGIPSRVRLQSLELAYDPDDPEDQQSLWWMADMLNIALGHLTGTKVGVE
jgi:hypothetical protein